MDSDRRQVFIDALESGASIDEASSLVKMPLERIEAEWLQGAKDASRDVDSDASALYLEGRAAIARWKVSLRAKASAAADAGRRSAAEHLRLIEEHRGAQDVREREKRPLLDLTPEQRADPDVAAALLLQREAGRSLLHALTKADRPRILRPAVESLSLIEDAP